MKRVDVTALTDTETPTPTSIEERITRIETVLLGLCEVVKSIDTSASENHDAVMEEISNLSESLGEVRDGLNQLDFLGMQQDV